MLADVHPPRPRVLIHTAVHFSTPHTTYKPQHAESLRLERGRLLPIPALLLVIAIIVADLVLEREDAVALDLDPLVHIEALGSEVPSYFPAIAVVRVAA